MNRCGVVNCGFTALLGIVQTSGGVVPFHHASPTIADLLCEMHSYRTKESFMKGATRVLGYQRRDSKNHGDHSHHRGFDIKPIAMWCGFVSSCSRLCSRRSGYNHPKVRSTGCDLISILEVCRHSLLNSFNIRRASCFLLLRSRPNQALFLVPFPLPLQPSQQRRLCQYRILSGPRLVP